MPIINKTAADLNTQTLAQLAGSTTLTNVANGTLVQGITNAVNAVLAQSYSDLNSSLAETYLSTASGTSLDLIGAMLGSPRGGSFTATRASVQQFYVVNGNFGSVPGISALNNQIPQGTIVQSLDGSIQYQTTAVVSFQNTDTQVFASVQALSSGSSSNVGPNILVVQNLGFPAIQTTNIAAIDNGTGVQNDAEYRYILSNTVTAAEAANELSVKLAALSVSGVSNVLIIPYYYGVGTYTVIIIGTTPIVSDTTLSNVLEIIQQVTALGEYCTVRAPRYVGIEITAQLIFDPTTSDADQATIANNVINNLYNYISNIPLGTGLIRDQIINQILNTDSRIQDVDDDPTSSTYMDIAIWTPTTIEVNQDGTETSNRVRTDLAGGNYIAYFDDKLIIEQNVQGYTHVTGYNPITINW